MVKAPTPDRARSSVARSALRPNHVAALGLAVVAIAFIAQNRDRVAISLFSIHVSAPAWILLTVMALVGIAVGALLRSRR